MTHEACIQQTEWKVFNTLDIGSQHQHDSHLDATTTYMRKVI